jgi:serine/threonine protein phosphatase PrpC
MYKHPEFVEDKQSGLIAEPELKSIEVTTDDKFLIMACDGLWDVLTHAKAVNFVLACVRRAEDKNAVPDWQEIARKLVDRAFKRGSTDNITAVIVSFM